MTYKEILTERIKIDAKDLLDEFERRGYKFEDETATEYVDIFGDEDLNEMCQWIMQMENFLEGEEE